MDNTEHAESYAWEWLLKQKRCWWLGTLDRGESKIETIATTFRKLLNGITTSATSMSSSSVRSKGGRDDLSALSRPFLDLEAAARLLIH